MNNFNFPKPIVGCCAYSGTGKTTLLIAVIPALIKRGLKVSVIKHTHHSFEIDQPGKDSYRLRHAGAQQVVLASRQRTVCMTETRTLQAEPVLADALAELRPAMMDLVLVEGFKHETFAKILLHRPALGKPLPQPLQSDIIAIASDTAVATGGLPFLDLNQPGQVADFIIAHFNLTDMTHTGN